MITETHDEVGGISSRMLSVSGQAPPVLCLHGYSDSADTWRPVLTRLHAAGRSAYAVDLPGFGQAAGRRDGPLVAQFDEFVDSLLDRWATVVMLGNSLGAATAVRAAARRPDRVVGLIALNDPLYARHWLAWLARTVTVPSWVWRAVGAIRVPRAPLPWVTRRALAQLLYGPGYTADRAVLDSWIEGYATWQAIAELGEGAFRYAREALGSHHGLQVSCPTAVVHGAHDRIIPVHASRTLAAQIPNAELTVLPRSGHCPQLDDPDAVVRIITEVIQRISTGHDRTGS
ncbi:alpha/beta fold hydrolase [Mycobacterium sp. M23085]|uniref:alpha/beta fold hydrolase n=1 Tax=Mycobacterium sp. M23085 TaxID=3378087 RepID=UPI00387790CF